MRTFLGRIAANAGPSLTAGAVVLAVGAGLGTLGLHEVPDRASPFSNGLVRGAIVVGSVGAAWCVMTFVVAMVATVKTERLRRQLGKALRQANDLREHLTNSGTEEWFTNCRSLLRAGLGEAEEHAFILELRPERLLAFSASNVTYHGMVRLGEIVRRPLLHARFDFDGSEDWMGDERRYASPVQSEGEATPPGGASPAGAPG